MAWETLKAAVSAVITDNGNNEITGIVLESLINNNLIPQLGDAEFKGRAQLNTNPGVLEKTVFYLTADVGVFANFGGFEVKEKGLYYITNSTGSWTGHPLLAEIFDKELSNDKKINFFSRYDTAENQFVDYNNRQDFVTKRAEIYSAFKQLYVFGFDKTQPHRLTYFWVNRQGASNPQYRFILDYWNGTAWVRNYDLATLTPVVVDDVWYINNTIGDKKVIAAIDLKDLPEEIDGQLETSSTSASYVISEKCFDTSANNDIQLAKQAVLESLGALNLETQSIETQSIETQTLATKNEILFNCFERYGSDLSVLDSEYLTGYKRKLKYQAIKNIELKGFNKDLPLMVSHFWVDSYNPAQNLYRIILKEWNGAAWVTAFDFQGQKNDLGIVDGKVFEWKHKIEEKEVVFLIDFSNLAVNDATTLNTGEPDLIISKKCYKDVDLEVFNSNKEIFNSRRKPTIAFIWDDLNDSDTLVYEIFRDYGFIPSFAIQSNKINDTNKHTLKHLYSKGCSMLAHSVTHPNMATTSIAATAVDDEMKNSKKAIEDLGIRVSGWVTPQSSLHSSFLPEMEKNFGYGFTNLNAGLFDATVDPIKMARFGLESEMINGNGVQGIKDRIDLAITNNELLVFYGHKIPSTYLDGNGDSQFVESELREVLTYLKTKTDDNLCFCLPCDEAVINYYKTPII